ncbi:hypothetical protein EJ377_14545 [Chryseobacterium arthrosphaerae]|uniref:Uncharacterized protein n=1 Tax=Chryseobacterium arthrosphaerae TaxID=651561 RepID=A0A432DS71_9FLAO|nr:hypothetical protein EJ377_14545 [Chryseobacterium arthrosphaerae]
MYWWTDYKDPNANVKGVGAMGMLKLSSYSGIPEIRRSYYNFNPYKSDNTLEWYSSGSRGNLGLATAAASFEGLSGSARVTTQGQYIKLYLPKANGYVFQGNQYVKTIGLSKVAHGVGVFSFWYGVATDGIASYNYVKNPTSNNKVHPGKAAVNTVFGITGTWEDY